MLTNDTEIRTQHTSDKEDAVYQPIHQVQGKVPAFVKKVRQLIKVSLLGGENRKNTVEKRLLVKGSV